VIDFHCHLDLYPVPEVVVRECVERGLYVLSVTTVPSAWRKTAQLADGVKHVRTAVGLHPQLAHQRFGELPLFDALVRETPYVGEIGLDGHPDFRAHWQIQRNVFEHILSTCSHAGGRIMSIHSRRAARDVIDALQLFPNAGTPVLHWFSGSFRELARAAELGCWFSVGPAMVISKKGKEIIARMPRERILTESDGPFAQVNGNQLMPWDVEDAIGPLANIWSLPADDTSQVLATNFRNLVKRLRAIE
jgi:TatD DNase family protein